jgi:2',3'-cyclic-nucleotide 2'-phosphodiesterase (5'-nucleotidase family)
MRKHFYVIFASVFFFVSAPSQARLLQIIHTNDLHSYFTGNAKGSGGYARVLTKIKQLKAEAAIKGIETLQVDAGDWGEGTSYFLSDNGADSIKALEMLGVEVATIGNHDYLLGGNTLGRQIRAADVKTKFVLANLVSTEDMQLGNTLVSFVDIERAKIPLRVIGLTTAESVFQYSVSPGKVLDPVLVGEDEGKKAKVAGRELVIALTHIGINQDSLLAKNSTSIDVIVGGHTHTKATDVKWVKNLNGKNVPIVQAWAHGLAVGSLLIDVKENGAGVEVVEYKLHEIQALLAADPTMVEFVAKSSAKRNLNFEHNWDEIVGETETPMTGYVDGLSVEKSSCWGYHLATAARKAVHANVGIHIASFEGVSRPAGPITYADLADSFPHISKFGDQGWEISTVFMTGLKLKMIMKLVSMKGLGVTFSGLGYKLLPDKSEVLYINESEVDMKGTYRIAFPSEVALAINTSFPAYRKYMLGLEHTGQYYWPVMVKYIQEHSPISCRN